MHSRYPLDTDIFQFPGENTYLHQPRLFSSIGNRGRTAKKFRKNFLCLGHRGSTDLVSDLEEDLEDRNNQIRDDTEYSREPLTSPKNAETGGG